TLDETGPGVMGGPSSAGCAVAETPAPAASFMPMRADFGRQITGPGGSAPVQSVFFSNSGTAPMAIGDVRIAGLNAGDFTIISNAAPAVLAPGAFFTVKVAFAPQATGDRQAVVYLSCDAANTTALAVPLGGRGWSGHVVGTPGEPGRTLVVGSSIA